MIDLRLAPGAGVRLCGHRGGLASAPENTLAAFRQARERGAAAAEIDVRLTADGHLVLMHDAGVDRTTDGHGPVEAMTLAEIEKLDASGRFSSQFAGEPVPTLKQAIALAAEIGLILRVELKDYDHNDRLFAAWERLLAEIPEEPPIVVCSFDLAQLALMKQRLPMLATMGVIHVRPADFMALVTPAKLDGLSVQPDLITRDDAELLHDNGCAISCFVPLATRHDARDAADRNRAARLRTWAQESVVDMLTGDDVNALRGLIGR